MSKIFFMMSRRYNKKTPESFNLVPTETPKVYLNSFDGTKWVNRYLYDFGVGPEYGFCRLPIPDFDQLVDLLVNSRIEDNRYGAAVILLQDYPDKLLSKCQKILEDERSLLIYREFFRILELKNPVNRTPIIGKSSVEIENDYIDWKSLSEKLNRHLK